MIRYSSRRKREPINIKRAAQILVIVIGVIFFLSRTQLIGELAKQVYLFFYKSSGENYAYMEGKLKEITAAINANDEKAVKALFCASIQEEGGELLEAKAYELTEYFNDDIFSQKGAFTDVIEGSDKEVKWFAGKYEVETYMGKYMVFFINQVEPKKDKDNLGLRYLQVSRKENTSVKFEYDINKTGILIIP